MRTILRYIICFILITLSIANSAVYANVERPNADFNSIELHSNCLLLMEKTTGDVLYERNGYAKMYPASTTKILTAIIVLENCYLNEVVTVSQSSISNVPPTYSVSGLKAGEKLRVEDLLYILLIPSSNDIANLLAEHTAGSIPAFAELMNKKASEIGLKGSHFSNPSGVHDTELYTTAYDLALLAKYAMNNEKFAEIVRTPSYTIPGTKTHPEEDRTYHNSNLLLSHNEPDYFYEYATGVKTGFTDQAGDSIVACAKKDGIEFIAVCLKGGYIDNRLREKFLDCKTLFEFAFTNYTTYYKNMQGKIEISEENSSNTALAPSNTPEELKPLQIEEPKNTDKNPAIPIKLILAISAVIIVLITVIIIIIEKRKSTIFQRRKR